MVTKRLGVPEVGGSAGQGFRISGGDWQEFTSSRVGEVKVFEFVLKSFRESR